MSVRSNSLWIFTLLLPFKTVFTLQWVNIQRVPSHSNNFIKPLNKYESFNVLSIWDTKSWIWTTVYVNFVRSYNVIKCTCTNKYRCTKLFYSRIFVILTGVVFLSFIQTNILPYMICLYVYLILIWIVIIVHIYGICIMTHYFKIKDTFVCIRGFYLTVRTPTFGGVTNADNPS